VKLRPDVVVVAPAGSLARHVTLIHEIGQDLVGGTLGDSHRIRDVAQSDARVVCNAQEDVSVVREEVPPPVPA
jgi:hypothetical protein